MEIIKNLIKRGFDARFFDTAKEAKAAALELIHNESCGFGGSITIDGMGIYDSLKAKGNELYWHWKQDDKAAAHKKAATADFYFTSANAITENGQIINVDGTGNRVAATLFGPKTVILIAGKNKITKDYDAGMQRIKKIACPKNAVRLKLATPCTTTECLDCDTAARMCNTTVILERRPKGIQNFYVFIVGEELGY